LLNPIEDDDGKGRHNQGSHAGEQESFHRRSPKDFVDRKVIRKRFLRTTERLTSQLVPRWSAQRRTLGSSSTCMPISVTNGLQILDGVGCRNNTEDSGLKAKPFRVGQSLGYGGATNAAPAKP
jgi:hypothetical protein